MFLPKNHAQTDKHPLDENPYSTWRRKWSWCPRGQFPNQVLGLLTRSYKMGTAGLPTCKRFEWMGYSNPSKEMHGCQWFQKFPRQNNTSHQKGPQAQCLSDVPDVSSRRTEMIATRMKSHARTLLKSKILRFEFWTRRIGVRWFCPRKCRQYQGLSSFDRFANVWGSDYHHCNATF